MALKHTVGVAFSRDYSVDVASVATITTADQSVTAVGVKNGRAYLVHIVGLDAGLMLNPFAIADADDSLELRFVNPTAGAINPAPGLTMNVLGL